MTLPEIKDRFMNELAHLYPDAEITSFFHLILEHHFDIKRIDLSLRPELRSQDWDRVPFDKALTDLLRERPIQYILGQAEFAGMSFVVNESVLIPRPETEELVNWVIESAKGLSSPRILDLGTGSGCIPVTLSRKIPGAEVHALDVSAAALETARLNAERLNAEVRFFEADVLMRNSLKEMFDIEDAYTIMVSNPPYVRRQEKDKMRGNVIKHEPEIALFVPDDDPLLFYRRIAEHTLQSLKSGGFIFFEINEELAESTRALLSDHNFEDIQIRKDIYGKDRMIRALKK